MRLLLNINNIYAKKSLGQNFITDRKFLKKIDDHIKTSDNNILIEIGPGKGALTELLLKNNFKKLYLIEKDYKLSKILKARYKSLNNVSILNYDALQYDYSNFSKEKNVIIYGNLPFNISTKLLIHWLSSEKWPSFFDTMILMFQKEVADRITAKHNNKKYGRLSVLVQSRCKVKKLIDAPASIFSPKPKVSGAVIKFEPIKDYRNINFLKLENLLQKSFSSRRKKIKNTLNDYRQFLLKMNIDENLRPENLSVAEYCSLVKLIG